MTGRPQGFTRRELLRNGIVLGAAVPLAGVLGACSSKSSASDASGSKAASSSTTATTAASKGGKAGKVLVRSPGGAYADAWKKASWDPFTAETGIEVVPVATNSAKILAEVQAGNVGVDVVDLGEFQTITLQKKNALQQFDYSKLHYTDKQDLTGAKQYYLVNIAYSTVLGYDSSHFSSGHPTDWQQFWDVARFPGARTLESLDAGSVNLEFALLADGVTMDKLYPIDLNRAFAKLGEIRKSIPKFWDSGASSSTLFSSKEVVLGAIWNGRLPGAPDKIEWNQAQRVNQGFSIPKGAPNVENAYKLIDYSMQPKVMAKFAETIAYGPGNKKAYDYISGDVAAGLPTSPEHVKTSFEYDAAWWVDNYQKVSDKWQEFLLG